MTEIILIDPRHLKHNPQVIAIHLDHCSGVSLHRKSNYRTEPDYCEISRL